MSSICYYEIRANLKSAILSSVAFLFMILAGMGKFTVMNHESPAALTRLMENVPRVIRVIYGMEGYDLSRASNYFALILFMLLIMIAFQAVFMGSHLLRREIDGKTSDFLFSKPLSRAQILWQKYLGGLMLILSMNILIALGCAFELWKISALAMLPRTILASLTTAIFFFSLGFLAASVFSKKDHAIRISLLLVLLSYLFVVLGQLFNWPWLEKISPLGFFPKAFRSKFFYPVVLWMLSLSAWLTRISCRRMNTVDLGN